jgi:ABC-type amino acid transport substrate-binding protein
LPFCVPETRLAASGPYPPYDYFDDIKAPAGFDVELMSGIAKAAA